MGRERRNASNSVGGMILSGLLLENIPKAEGLDHWEFPRIRMGGILSALLVRPYTGSFHYLFEQLLWSVLSMHMRSVDNCNGGTHVHKAHMVGSTHIIVKRSR